ncbi:MAG: DUF1343 domain-containing protein [Bacteroidota bacterium]
MKKIVLVVFTFLITLCSFAQIKTGAEQTDLYLPQLKNKTVVVLVNHTATIKQTHLVDSLLKLKIKVKKIFCPEHGFRGDADAGEHVKNAKDKKTGLPIVSLYGANKKPKPTDLKGIDVVVFDIQDVGARFYTYISSMHYMMEACAENNVEFIVLDRPNPNGFYIDGPILKKENKSFIGMHPIPIVHGLTIGELAQMINGEKWLENGVKCKLTVVPCLNYTHKTMYELPIKPSPNLPNANSIILYPSVCLFEGTVISVGRGTPQPFEIIGHPSLSDSLYSFTPVAIEGASKNPPFKDQLCYGYKLCMISDDIKSKKQLNLSYLLKVYSEYGDKANFFTNFFRLLAGTDELQKQIEQGLSEEEIRKSWKREINVYKHLRKNYLLYEDFE